MKAMVLHDREKPFRLEERPKPRAGLGEAVMRVRAAGVGLTLVNMRPATWSAMASSGRANSPTSACAISGWMAR